MMQCTKTDFVVGLPVVAVSQSKVSRWPVACFNFYAFTFTFWFCIGRLNWNFDGSEDVRIKKNARKPQDLIVPCSSANLLNV